nr:hypothetical protein OG296_03800 [Streptomyces sp. NBC_01001]WSW63231.1 hypothetical protein OG513_34285 [Streptomyces sp. NBC_00998]
MTEFMSTEALARLAGAGDPQVRLMLALAALGADRTQILGASSTGRRGEIELPESERARREAPESELDLVHLGSALHNWAPGCK